MPQAKQKPPVVPFDVIEHLAAIDRTPGSPGEAEAAAWFAQRLAAAGCEVAIDEARFYDGYARPLAKMTAAAALGGLLAQTKRGRRVGGLLAGLAAVGIADDASNGPRVFRQLTGSPIPTQNVVAIAGEVAIGTAIGIIPKIALTAFAGAQQCGLKRAQVQVRRNEREVRRARRVGSA